MKMKQLTCEMCGSTDLIKQDGVFVCQSCGTKYSVEEAKKMMIEGTVEVTGTVKVDNSAAVENYLKMARSAMDAKNNEEAENYANKIIELAPQHSEAWRIKGEAAGWQSTVAKPRLSDTVTYWINAITYAEDERKPYIREDVANEYSRLLLAMVSLTSGNFGKLQQKENVNTVKQTIEDGIAMMNMLLSQGGVSFNRAYIYNSIAEMINKGVIEGFKNASSEFGPEHSNMAKWQWERFTEAGDQCIDMLKIALQYVRDDSLAKTICENLVTIGQTVRDSCSWKFNINSWNYDSYEKDYMFTDEAKEYRNESIDKWRKKKKLFKAGRIERVLRGVRAERVEAETKRGREKYWEDHNDEKLELEKERRELIAKNDSLNAQIENLPVSQEILQLQADIASLRKQIASLGLFKGKEKRALQDKIDQVSADITEKKQVEEETKQQLQEEIEANKQRISKIDAEFRKPRGRIATKEKSIAIKDAVIDGKFAITPEQFVDYMRDVIPKPYYLEPTLKIVGTHMGNRLGLEKQYQIGIHDSSVKRSDGNDNTGCVIFIQADSPTDKIQSISLEGSQDLTDETAQMWCKLGSNLLLLLTDDISRDEAEDIVCRILLDKSSSLYGVGKLKVEYASFDYSILGIMTMNQNCVLIRTQEQIKEEAD